jgi:hypothetical protein
MGGVFNTVNLHVYHYAGNNPVKYIDPDGRDIVLLNRSYGALGYGHNAVMVGNNKDGWILYSKDGLDVNTRKVYSTFSDFLRENDTAKRKDSYDRAAVLKTSASQDKAMQEYGDQIYNRKYALEEKTDSTGEIRQNCSDLVADIIEKADDVSITNPKIREEYPESKLTLKSLGLINNSRISYKTILRQVCGACKNK